MSCLQNKYGADEGVLDCFAGLWGFISENMLGTTVFEVFFLSFIFFPPCPAPTLECTPGLGPDPGLDLSAQPGLIG